MTLERRFIFLLFIFVLFFSGLLTGCSLFNGQEDDESWRDEIIYAEACGLDGLPCCTDGEAACQYGLECCSDPNNIKNNRCVEDCVCGKENAYCCKDDPKCDNGLACFRGDCVPCGEEEQPCCYTEDKCSGELICYSETCLQCGLANNPCCSTGEACINQDRRDNTRTECQGEICRECGFNKKIACESEPLCNEEHILNNNKCLACGGFNQPCCREEADVDYKCKTGLICEAGFCNK